MGGAAPVIITVVAVVASVYAGPEVGAAILESMGTTAAAVGVSDAVVGGAAITGATSAVNAAVQGKNIEGILTAGAIGTAAGVAGGAAGEAVGGATSGALGQTGSKIAAGGASGATSGFVGSELSGSNLKQATRNAEIGGATGLATSALTQGLQESGVPTDTSKMIAGASSPFIKQDVSNLFGSSTPASQVGSGATGGTSTQTIGGTPTTGTPTVGSAALGQALNIGGGDISPPVNIGGGEKTTPNVWNTASLRVKDETGS
jgi:hypothetical protein